MANISLRAYNREISNLIDRGQTDEAVAHCQYILQTYPKYIETYRLLGKAYLEGRRHKEAVDVFQRVLSVAPDDFITHVGMSIIREEEDNLAASIWHMERAFEVQPSNQAIQDELKHLYGKRDGEEPLKIRLTRGALCRMYARGNQYRQAVAEIKSLLVEAPDRIDLEILLARMYYSLNMKSESTDLCGKLLEKFPHCLEANRIMHKILLDSGKKADAESFKQKIIGLDPYESLVNDSYPSSEQVPEDMVSVAKFAYDPNAKPIQTTPPVDVAPTLDKEAAPDWVVSDLTGGDEDMGEKGFTRILDSTVVPQEDQAKEPPSETPPPVVDEVIKFDEPTQEETDLISEGMNNIVVNLPEDASTPTQPVEMDSESDELPDWLKETGKSSTETEEEIPDWLKASGWAAAGTIEEDAPPTSVIHIEEEEAVEAPDIPIAPAEIPDWVQGLAPAVDDAALEPESAVVTEEAVSEETSAKLNEWLSEEPAKADQASSGGTASLHLPDEEEEEAEAGTPDWLKGLDEQAKTTKGQSVAFALEDTPIAQADTSVPKAPISQPTQTDKLDLDDDFPIAGGTSILSPDDVPDWLQDLAAVPDSDGVVEDVAETQDPVKSFSIEEPTRPSPRSTEPPQEILTTALPPEDNVPEWLSEFSVEPNDKITQTLPVTPEEMAGEMPSWLSMLDEDTSDESEPIDKAVSQEFPAVTQKIEPVDAESLAMAESGEEKPTTSILPQNPEDQAEELPEWLKELDGYPEGTSPIADAAQSTEGEFPDWLKGFGDSEPITASAITPASLEDTSNTEGEEVPNWLSDLDLKGSSVESSAVDVPDWLKGEAPEPTSTQEPSVDVITESPEFMEIIQTEAVEIESLVKTTTEEDISEQTQSDTEATGDEVLEVEEIIDPSVEETVAEEDVPAPAVAQVAEQAVQLETEDPSLVDEIIVTEASTDEPNMEETAGITAESEVAVPELVVEEPPTVELEQKPEAEFIPELVSEETESDSPDEKVILEAETSKLEDENIEEFDQPEANGQADVSDLASAEVSDEFVQPDQVAQVEEEIVVEPIEIVEDFAEAKIIEVVEEPEMEPEPVSESAAPIETIEEQLATEVIDQDSKPQEVEITEVAEEEVPPSLQTEDVVKIDQIAADDYDSILDKALQLVETDDLESAQKEFDRLIHAEKNLEKVIEQLSAATEKHPTDFGLWMSLGDAFGRSGKLQKALDSYSKAEEYLQ